MKPKFKYQWYQEIFNNTSRILEEARKSGKEIGLDKLKNKIGLYPGSSSCPGSLPRYVLDAIIKANRDRGRPHDRRPPTPPDIRVRIRRFEPT